MQLSLILALFGLVWCGCLGIQPQGCGHYACADIHKHIREPACHRTRENLVLKLSMIVKKEDKQVPS